MSNINLNNKTILKELNDEEVVFNYSFEKTKTPLITYNNVTVNSSSESDIIDVEFEEIVPESHKLDYSVAAASGLLCSALDIFWVGQFSLEKAQEIGNEKANDFVIKVAQKVSNSKGKKYTGKSLEGAIRHLEDLFPMPGDSAKDYFGGGLQHHFRDFTHHPTIVGLLFSLFAQFSGFICGTDSNGNFDYKRVDEKSGYIGKDVLEKILFGTIHWMFHLISDMAGSSSTPGEGTGIPGPILSFLKEASTLPIIKDIKVKYKGQEDIKFSMWLSKLFNGTYFWDKETNQRIKFDLRTEMGITSELLKQSLPVIINECVVRGYYFANRLYKEIKNNDIKNVKDIEKISTENIIPINNKVLFRMLTISTGVFSIIDIAHAAINAKNGKKEDYLNEFITRVNIPGLCRLVFAIKNDAKYIYQDIKKMYDSYQHKIYTPRRELYEIPNWNTFSIEQNQVVLLYSLEYQILKGDVTVSKGTKTIEKKKHWISIWKKSINKLLSNKKTSLIENENDFYKMLIGEINSSVNISWLYTVILEALQFKPYTKVSDVKENPYRGLRLKNDYIHKEFLQKQSIIDKKEISKIENTYAKYKRLLLNNSTKIAVSVASTVVATIATGGTALVFAPEIATALVGGTFAGLYGAALTSASLAAIGGGALVAGGLGMAGGTAIIASGGAVIGLVGGGAITASSAVLGSSKDLTLDMLAKVLTITKICIIEKYERQDIAEVYTDNMSLMIARMEHDIDVMKDNLQNVDKNDLKDLKKRIKTSKTNLTYMRRSYNELIKLSKKK